MAGERSKTIVNRIRERLSDEAGVKVNNNRVIYEQLNDAQRTLLIDNVNLKATIEYPLVVAQSEYVLDATVYKVVAVRFSENIDTDITITPGLITLSNTDNISGSEVMEVDVFLKQSVTGKDDISEINDPLLSADYNGILVDMVLSQYRDAKQGFKTLEAVVEEARRVSLALLNPNRVYRKNPLRRIF